MIRKMLVIAAAVAMPAAAMAGVTAIGGAGVASAKALAPVSVSCNMSGTVTFNKGGLSTNGFITNKTTTTTKTAISPFAVGGPAACPTKGLKNTIASSLITPPGGGAAQTCWDVAPSVSGTGKSAVLVPGTPSAGAAPACLQGATSAGTMTVKSVKNAVKDLYWSGTTGGLTATGTASIAKSLAPGIQTTDNGTKIQLDINPDGSGVTGGLCSDFSVGFFLNDNVENASTHAVIGTYSMDICLGGDSGPLTSGNFGVDLLTGSSPQTITAATLSSVSNVAITITP